MRRNGWGRICCITSYSVVQPIPGLALSNMARAGLWAWAKTAAQDLAAEGTRHHPQPAVPGAARHRPDAGAGRIGRDGGSRPTSVGWPPSCAPSQAGFVNGAALVVDGGATLAL